MPLTYFATFFEQIGFEVNNSYAILFGLHRSCFTYFS